MADVNMELMEAAKAGDIKQMMDLINKGADVNTKDKNGATPLHHAALFVKTEAIKLLLEKGANVNAKDPDSRTPLHQAVRNGKPEDIKLLLDKGADVNTEDKSEETPLLIASRYRNTDAIKLLLAKGADIDARDDRRNTALHNAAMYGKLEDVTLLLSKGACVGVRNKQGETPLYMAARNEDGEASAIMKRLVDEGVDIRSSMLSDTPQCMTDFTRAVELASSTRGAEAKKKLLTQIVEKLSSSRVGFVGAEEQTAMGWTPLHRAAQSGKIDEIKHLLEQGANINARTITGRTPLHFAENAETIKLLLEKGAAIDAKSSEGTLLHRLIDGHGRDYLDGYALLKAFLEKGPDMNARDDLGNTALHKAIVPLNYPRDNLNPAAKILLDHKANVNSRNAKGDTPLHWSAAHDCKDSIILLLEKGADINAKNRDGDTPLHIASKHKQTEIIKLLIEKGADIKAKNNSGKTPVSLRDGDAEGHDMKLDLPQLPVNARAQNSGIIKRNS